MAMFKGLINTLQIRDDGWVELIIQAVQAGNTTQTFYIQDLDGDVTVAHKRLGQLSLLRDAISRSFPVQIDYEADPAQGNLVTEVVIHPRPSITGRTFGSTIQGIVIGISVIELWPVLAGAPYANAPNIAGITLLKEDGTIVSLQLDLQRDEALTMHSMLALLRAAHKNRRPVIILTATSDERRTNPDHNVSIAFNPSSYIESVEWVSVPEETLDYCHAFIECLGQRYESYNSINPTALSQISVVYTTAPAQTPEGDVSDNGSFKPVTQTAWVHADSPLLVLLKMALKKGFQVQLGLFEDHIHEVEVAGHLGSASRPIWICVNQSFIQENPEGNCSNTPTIQSISSTSLSEMSLSLFWKGNGYFNEGIWRFQVSTSGTYKLKIDNKLPCCSQSAEECCCEKNDSKMALNHVYLKGMHSVELTLYNQQIAEPFTFLAYRIR